jgi:lysophospholipase L1-like esterase
MPMKTRFVTKLWGVAFAAAVAFFAAIGVFSAAVAAERPPCAVPDNLLFSGSRLNYVSAAIAGQRKLTIAVVGTGSSALAGPDGPPSAYPARLEAALTQRLSGASVKVVPLVRSRQTGDVLAKGMAKLLSDEKPDLVIWQAGTIDAMRRVDLDSFKNALEEGIDTIHKRKADVILMNMQYSPRTESVIPEAPYAEVMRVVALLRNIPLYDRLAIMRHWSEVGAFDFYAAGRDNVLAQRVHNCIGRTIAALIIDAGRLQLFELKAGQ